MVVYTRYSFCNNMSLCQKYQPMIHNEINTPPKQELTVLHSKFYRVAFKTKIRYINKQRTVLKKTEVLTILASYCFTI